MTHEPPRRLAILSDGELVEFGMNPEPQPTDPTDREIHHLLLRCGDDAYFEALRKGQTGADALTAAVKAAVTQDRRDRA